MPIPKNIQIKQLDLELNGGCNFACEMCPQAEGRERDFLKKLPPNVFRKIIDDALHYGLESVSLHGSGEPTLNSNMPEMVEFAKSKGIRCVSFTNGYKLTEELSRRLIESGIDVLRISCIGYDRESYHRWMSKDAYQQVRENVKRFVELNGRMNGQSQAHIYHLVTDNNDVDREVALYKRNWVDYTGAKSEIWRMHNWSGSYDAPYQRLRDTAEAKKRSCGRPFSPLLQVRAGGLDGHHGAVVACCMVLGRDSQAVLGHLDTQTIREVVEGQSYESLRAAHREERFGDISYCENCDQLFDYSEALVWTNIEGRTYGESKVVESLDHRSYAGALESIA